MKATFLAAALMLGVPIAATGIAHAKPAAPHYDCTKAANKTKTACKAVASTGASSSSAASSPKLAAAVPAKTKTFDCTKAGNKNKAQCKTTMVATATPLIQTKPQTLPGSATPSGPTPAATVAKTAATTAPATVPAGAPTGATAQCKDGTYSMSKHHSGSCSHHGGVAHWLS